MPGAASAFHHPSYPRPSTPKGPRRRPRSTARLPCAGERSRDAGPSGSTSATAPSGMRRRWRPSWPACARAAWTPSRSTSRSARPRTPSRPSSPSHPRAADASSAATRTAAGWPACGGRRRVSGPGLLLLPAPSAPAGRSGPRRGSPTGRRSPARPCCCQASPTRSPGSTCCGRRWRGSPHGELVTWPRLGHTLKPVLDEALDRAAAFILALPDP